MQMIRFSQKPSFPGLLCQAPWGLRLRLNSVAQRIDSAVPESAHVGTSNAPGERATKVLPLTQKKPVTALTLCAELHLPQRLNWLSLSFLHLLYDTLQPDVNLWFGPIKLNWLLDTWRNVFMFLEQPKVL